MNTNTMNNGTNEMNSTEPQVNVEASEETKTTPFPLTIPGTIQRWSIALSGAAASMYGGWYLVGYMASQEENAIAGAMLESLQSGFVVMAFTVFLLLILAMALVEKELRHPSSPKTSSTNATINRWGFAGLTLWLFS